MKGNKYYSNLLESLQKAPKTEVVELATETGMKPVISPYKS